MATREQLERALIEADRAGNVADAQVLAREVARLRAQEVATPAAQEKPDPAPTQEEIGWLEKYWLSNPMHPLNRRVLSQLPGAGADMGLEAGGAAGGQALGAATGPFAPAAVPLLGAIGGAAGNTLAQLRRGGDFSIGEVMGAGAMSAIPGAGPGASTIGRAVKEAGKNVAGNVAAAEIQSLADTGEPATKEQLGLATLGAVGGAMLGKGGREKVASDAEKLFRERMRPFRDLRKEGFVINPDEIGASTMGGTRLAGKAMLGQTASQRNQYGVQRLSREDLGLSKEAVPFRPDKLVGGKIVPGELEVVIKESYEPYETIKSISERAKKEGERFFKISDPHESAVMRSTPEGQKLLVEAAADVDALKNARIAERDAWRRLKSNEPNAYDAWKQAKESVKALDDRITAAAESAGDPKLAERLKDSRQKIAKAYAYMNATDKTTGLVDLRDLAAQFNDDAFLTGNARRMAEFYNAFSRNAQEAVRGQPPGGEHLGINFAAVSAAQGNPVGMTLAGVPFMRGPASRAIFSEFAQNRFAQPRMQLAPEDFSAALLRFAPQTASRGMIKDEELQKFLQNQPPVRFNRP